ncbi:putative NAD(P)-binding protein [Ulvibacter sp. MAR_2010_11]|uniref:NAD(P)H-binding protein n=1 Tax=Ulvibacter sp. MAR_2010_11 TaxID=1250229 RepID=UPI000C2C3277|nr:NAD(P)H-binding protein [Ulvibacter sp. MAR_2010_11]PKA83017.1 putative NAD(P)-binding protein [Ulvibacter sp. MAR_2010_11]
MPKTAIILGATGLTGTILLENLLTDSTFKTVKLFSRSSVGIANPKIEEHLIDLFQLEQYEEDFKADVVICCIGTTLAKTPNKETYRKIDYGIPVTAAKLAKENGIESFVVISALGADVDSRVFYNKTKGEMERDVLQQNIKNTFILQPSLIGGNRSEKRTGERMAQIFMGIFGFLLPKNYKIIQPETIAKAMQVLAAGGYSEKRITSAAIKKIASK